MTRQRDLLLTDAVAPSPNIALTNATVGAETVANTFPITSGAQHVAVAITAGHNSVFFPNPIARWQFFPDDGFGAADLTAPEIEPVYSRNQVYDGAHSTSVVSPSNCYAYVYLIEMPLVPVHAVPLDGVGYSFASLAAIGINGLVEIGATAETVSVATANSQEVAPGTDGYTDLNGLWLLAAHPAADRAPDDDTNVTWPASPIGGPGTTGGDPGFLVGYTGPASGGPLEWTFAPGPGGDDDSDGNPGDIVGFWMQLLPMTTPDVVELPPSTEIVNVFEATTGTIAGQVRSLPVATITNVFEGSIELDQPSATWRAVLVDAEGTTRARMPQAVIGDIVETLNDIFTAEVTIPIRSLAGALVDAAEVLPDLEVQIWRGHVLWLWGPIIDAIPDAEHWRLVVNDARWHLTRRHIGELGGSFGGKPPYFHDPMVNERFTTGDITGWSILRTVTAGGFVGFDVPDPDAIEVWPPRQINSDTPMVRCAAPEDPLDNYQLFQDLRIRGPQNRRPLRVTLSGWWFIPSDGGYAPNNQRMGLLLATLRDDAVLPAHYYLPEDVGFTTLDELTPRDSLFQQQCEITLPPGVETTVHVAVCFPQGVSYVGGLEVQVDDGLLFDESPSTMGPQLIEYAQMAEFLKDDVNLDAAWNTIGDRVVREYVFRDHTNIGAAIATLAGEGWFDWHPTYTPSSRIASFTAPRRGGYRPGLRLRLDADGRGNVDRIERRRMWQSGATALAVQTRNDGNHERAARSAHELTLEEITTAPREPRDYELQRAADKLLAPSAAATVVEVHGRAGDERLLFGLEVGDSTDVRCAYPGHRVNGRHRVVRREISPARDAVKLTMNPDPV